MGIDEMNSVQEKLKAIADAAARLEWEPGAVDWATRSIVADHDFPADPEIPDDQGDGEQQESAEDGEP